MNENWPRWIHSSLSKYFADNQGTYKIYFQGENRNSDQRSLWADCFLSGPNIREVSNGVYKLDISIEFIISDVVQLNDLFRSQRFSGYLASLLVNNLSIYRLGTGTADDETSLGCAQREEDVVIINFNDPSKSALAQVAVRAKYTLTVKD